jgi:hypothetical protein
MSLMGQVSDLGPYWLSGLCYFTIDDITIIVIIVAFVMLLYPTLKQKKKL